MAWGLEARVPFLDKAFLEVAMNINPEEKMFSKGTSQQVDEDGCPKMEKVGFLGLCCSHPLLILIVFFSVHHSQSFRYRTGRQAIPPTLYPLETKRAILRRCRILLDRRVRKHTLRVLPDLHY